MGDDQNKKREGDLRKINDSGREELRKHEQDRQRLREETAKIEKRGAGAGDRPKRD